VPQLKIAKKFTKILHSGGLKSFKEKKEKREKRKGQR